MVLLMTSSLRLAIAALLLAFGADTSSRAQAPEPNPAAPAVEPAAGIVIAWEVMNRFRMFRDERDFRRHAEAARGRTVLAAEQALAEASEGRGWARDMVVRLCLDGIGRVANSEIDWRFTASAGVGADPLTGRGNMLTRDEKSSELHAQARWTPGRSTFSGEFHTAAPAGAYWAVPVEFLPISVGASVMV